MSAPNTVTTNISYFVPPVDGSRAYQTVNANSATGIRDRNWKNVDQETTIENLRGKEADITLDTAGFQLFNRPSQHKSFANDAEIENVYYPESVQLIKELTGASRVVLFDHSKSSLL